MQKEEVSAESAGQVLKPHWMGAGRLEGAGVAARGIAGTLQDVFDVPCSG